jgi:hypothetical protein
MKKLIYFLMLVVLIQLATAQELSIVYPKNPAFIANQPFRMHFNVYNSTGFNLINGMVNCQMLIYNNSNDNIFSQNLTWDSNNIELVASLNNTYSSKIGSYPYLVQCNSASEGGYISSTYEISPDGKNHEINEIYPILAYLFGTIVILLWFSTLLESNSEIHEGIKLLLNLFSLVLILVASGQLLMYVSSTNILDSTVSLQTTTHIVTLAILGFTILLFILIFMKNMLEYLKDKNSPRFDK